MCDRGRPALQSRQASFVTGLNFLLPIPTFAARFNAIQSARKSSVADEALAFAAALPAAAPEPQSCLRVATRPSRVSAMHRLPLADSWFFKIFCAMAVEPLLTECATSCSQVDRPSVALQNDLFTACRRSVSATLQVKLKAYAAIQAWIAGPRKSATGTPEPKMPLASSRDLRALSFRWGARGPLGLRSRIPTNH